MSLRSLTLTRRDFPPPRTYNVKCLLKKSTFLTTWNGLALFGLRGGHFF